MWPYNRELSFPYCQTQDTWTYTQFVSDSVPSSDGHAATGISSGAEDPLESNYSLEALLDIQVRDKRTRIVQAMQN